MLVEKIKVYFHDKEIAFFTYQLFINTGTTKIEENFLFLNQFKLHLDYYS